LLIENDKCIKNEAIYVKDLKNIETEVDSLTSNLEQVFKVIAKSCNIEKMQYKTKKTNLDTQIKNLKKMMIIKNKNIEKENLNSITNTYNEVIAEVSPRSITVLVELNKCRKLQDISVFYKNLLYNIENLKNSFEFDRELGYLDGLVNQFRGKLEYNTQNLEKNEGLIDFFKEREIYLWESIVDKKNDSEKFKKIRLFFGKTTIGGGKTRQSPVKEMQKYENRQVYFLIHNIPTSYFEKNIAIEIDK
ncbi:16314_t:CDS:2, partial [Gigaspora margarita]